MLTARCLDLGVIAPGLSGPNVRGATALRSAIGGALEAVSNNTKEVIAIIPDAAIRVLLLDFEALPLKVQESNSVVRFRLKKSLPFDVEQAALSYDVRRNNGNVHVVAAVSPNSIIQEYEAAFRDAGYAPGISYAVFCLKKK